MRSSALLAAILALGMSAAAFATAVPKLKPMVLSASPGKLDWPPHKCPLTLNYDSWEVIAQSQHPDFDWKLPPGVAVNLEPHQPLLIQTHYLRSGLTQKKSQKYLTKTEVFPVDPKTVTAHAGALFLNDRSVCVPPHSESTATSRCTI